MAQVKLDLHNKSVPEKIQMGRKVGVALGDPAPAPYTARAATLKAKTDALEGAHDAAEMAAVEATNATRVEMAAETDFDAAYGGLGGQVETETAGDPTGITSRGYGVPAEPNPVTSLGFVSGFNVTTTNLPGTFDFAWDRSKGEVTFTVRGRKTTDPAGVFSFNRTTTKTRMRADGFETGSTYEFSACANGSGEMVSPWSDPFTKTAA